MTPRGRRAVARPHVGLSPSAPGEPSSLVAQSPPRRDTRTGNRPLAGAPGAGAFPRPWRWWGLRPHAPPASRAPGAPARPGRRRPGSCQRASGCQASTRSASGSVPVAMSSPLQSDRSRSGSPAPEPLLERRRRTAAWTGSGRRARMPCARRSRSGGPSGRPLPSAEPGPGSANRTSRGASRFRAWSAASRLSRAFSCSRVWRCEASSSGMDP